MNRETDLFINSIIWQDSKGSSNTDKPLYEPRKKILYYQKRSLIYLFLSLSFLISYDFMTQKLDNSIL